VGPVLAMEILSTMRVNLARLDGPLVLIAGPLDSTPNILPPSSFSSSENKFKCAIFGK